MNEQDHRARRAWKPTESHPWKNSSISPASRPNRPLNQTVQSNQLPRAQHIPDASVIPDIGTLADESIEVVETDDYASQIFILEENRTAVIDGREVKFLPSQTVIWRILKSILRAPGHSMSPL